MTGDGRRLRGGDMIRSAAGQSVGYQLAGSADTASAASRTAWPGTIFEVSQDGV
jgi:hypothetical protein